MKKINNKILLYSLFIIPFLIFFVRFIMFGIDIHYLLNEGKYVLENGIPYIDPFTIHEGLNLVMHQWLTSVVFFAVYSLFGYIGLLIFIPPISALLSLQ